MTPSNEGSNDFDRLNRSDLVLHSVVDAGGSEDFAASTERDLLLRSENVSLAAACWCCLASASEEFGASSERDLLLRSENVSCEAECLLSVAGASEDFAEHVS